MYCQLEYLADCPLVDIQHTLDELPATLDETYERTLREIKDINSEYARRLLLCVAVASRPLRVEELAETFAIDFEGQIPVFHEERRLKNPVEAVLSTCPTFLSVVEDRHFQVVRFSHFTVKEFLTSFRFAGKHDSISRRYHISMIPAHTLMTQACLGMLLHLNQNITRDSLTRFPLAEYAAEHWFEHARFEDVSQNVEEGIKQLFDWKKPHLSIWLWIHGLTEDRWQQHREVEWPFPPHGTPLHYAAFCGLHNFAKMLATEDPRDVNSHNFDNASTPLHLTSEEGHVDVARMLMEFGADLSARDMDSWTPLHSASSMGHVNVVRILMESNADASAQDLDNWTPLLWASSMGHVDVARMLLEFGADVSAQTQDGRTPLHWASGMGHVDVAQMLIERGADVSAQDKDGWTPLHWASNDGHVDLAQMIVGRGANVSIQAWDGWTPLHCACSNGHVDVARILAECGADMSAQDKLGWTPLRWASNNGYVDVTRNLVGHSSDG